MFCTCRFQQILGLSRLVRVLWLGGDKEFEKMKMSPAAREEEDAWKLYHSVPIYKRRKCRLCCCACFTVSFSLAIVTIALSQTIFKLRQPKVSLHDVRVNNLSLNFNLASLSAMLNLSLSANVQVRNPNFFDFKYTDSRMAILYRGEQVGVGELAAGDLRSRSTVELPWAISVEVVKLLGNVLQDLASNVATLKVNSVLLGRVDFFHIFKRHATAILNCTVDVFLSNRTLKQNDCKQAIKL